MDCIKNDKQGAALLIGYCAGSLDPAAAAGIEAHIQQCAECKKMVDAQCAVWETLDAWTPVEVSSNFDARLYARISAEQQQPAWQRWWSRLLHPATPYSWWKPAASLAVAAAIVSVVVVTQPPQRHSVAVQKTEASQTSVAKAQPTAPAVIPAAGPAALGSQDIDLQQVQQALDDLEILTPAAQATSSPL